MDEAAQFRVDPGDPLTIIDLPALAADLGRLGLAHWLPAIRPRLEARLSASGHGDYARWQAALARLAGAEDDAARRSALLALNPWRKGPFRIGDITIDAEWRSDRKWERLAGHIAALDGRQVLDVGCGNGWYALRMRAAGARAVIGIDPSALFNIQFAAVRSLLGVQHVHVLPLRLDELPPDARAFDTTFSMGVLYHRRDPAAHLDALRRTLKTQGELVLETLVVPGDDDDILVPANRYARMRNVWQLPTVGALRRWLDDAGFDSIRVVDVTATTPAEQRTTEWMHFESLADALDPDDPSRTVEGLPAPTRAIVIAAAP